MIILAFVRIIWRSGRYDDVPPGKGFKLLAIRLLALIHNYLAFHVWDLAYYRFIWRVSHTIWRKTGVIWRITHGIWHIIDLFGAPCTEFGTQPATTTGTEAT